MTSTPRLPPELWDNILDLAIEASINPSEQCSYIAFPYIMEDLIFKGKRGVIDPTYNNLRLVCRLFKDLLGPSPRFVMTGATQVPPRKSKSLCIEQENLSATWLGILAAERAKYSHIVTLDIVCHTHTEGDQPASFNTLCQVTQAIPNVRTLTLRLKSVRPRVHIWWLISNAFPLLTCLSLLVERGIYSPPGDTLVTLESLDILHISGTILYKGFRAPLIRHLSLGRFSFEAIALLQHSPLLESFIFGSMNYSGVISVTSLKHLRLFGFPASMNLALQLIGLDQCPSLSHLWIYATSFPLDHIHILPAVCRVTLDLCLIQEYDQTALSRLLETSDIVHRGTFTIRRETHGNGLIILERTAVTAPKLEIADPSQALGGPLGGTNSK